MSVPMSIWPTESGDGSVSSEDRWRKMAKYWLPSGVLQGYLSELACTIAAGVVTVGTGAAWVDGHYLEITAGSTEAAGSDGLLVAQFVKASQSGQVIFNAGVTTPVTTDAVYEIPLYQVISGALTDLRQPILPGGVRTAAVRAYRTTDTANLTPSTATAIALNAEDYDTHAFHDNSTNPSRFTIPAGMTGLYQVRAQLSFGGDSTGNRTAEIRKGGSTVLDLRRVNPVQSQTTGAVVEWTGQLKSGEYIEVYATTTGVAVPIKGGTELTHVEVVRLGAI